MMHEPTYENQSMAWRRLKPTPQANPQADSIIEGELPKSKSRFGIGRLIIALAVLGLIGSCILSGVMASKGVW